MIQAFSLELPLQYSRQHNSQVRFDYAFSRILSLLPILLMLVGYNTSIQSNKRLK